MITRLSKIARLPANIREQLNRRLHDGEFGRTILPWVNALPETKAVMAEHFAGKPIRHQNLSEWRHTGYQDWLNHQARLEWFDRLSEEDNEIKKHDASEDTCEAISNYFMYEIGLGIRALQTIKNPFHRMERMQHLSREFARLQNAFNWSRRVQLEFDKHNAAHSGTGVPPLSSPPGAPAPVAPELREGGSRRRDPHDHSEAKNASTAIHNNACEAIVPATQSPVGDDVRSLKNPELSAPIAPERLEERQSTGALPDAPRISTTIPHPPAPSALPFPNSSTPKLPGAPKPGEGGVNSSTPSAFHPVPPVATPTPRVYSAINNQSPACPPPQNGSQHKVFSIPLRGRRFICIEG